MSQLPLLPLPFGTVLDTLGGIGSRDYNSDWKVNCEKSRAMFAESVLEDHCTQYGYDAHTSIRFDDDSYIGH